MTTGPPGADGSMLRPPARAADFAPAARRSKKRRGGALEPGCGPGALGLDSSISESAIYTSLRAAEEQVDASLASRVAGLRDALRVVGAGAAPGPPKAPRRLRLHAHVETTPASESEPARWVVTIYGALLEPAEAAGLAPPPPPPQQPDGEAAAAPPQPRPFLSAIRRLRVDGGPPGHDWASSGPVAPAASPLAGGGRPATVTWVRSAALGGAADAAAALAALPHALVIRRAGDAALDLRVSVEADGYAERVRPSPALAAVLGSGEPTTRGAALDAVLRLAARAGCHAAATAPGILTLTDDRLAALLGGGGGGRGGGGGAPPPPPTISTSDVPAVLGPHLAPCPPPAFTVPVRPGTAPATHTWDLDVDVAPPDAAAPGAAAAAAANPLLLSGADRAASAFADALARDPAIASADADLAAALRRLREHVRRRAFLLGFATDPVAFIDGMASAQAADLRAVGERGGGGPGGGAGVGMPGAAVFAGGWVDEVVARMLQRRQAAGQ